MFWLKRYSIPKKVIATIITWKSLDTNTSPSIVVKSTMIMLGKVDPDTFTTDATHSSIIVVVSVFLQCRYLELTGPKSTTTILKRA